MLRRLRDRLRARAVRLVWWSAAAQAAEWGERAKIAAAVVGILMVACWLMGSGDE